MLSWSCVAYCTFPGDLIFKQLHRTHLRLELLVGKQTETVVWTSGETSSHGAVLDNLEVPFCTLVGKFSQLS
ncbi:hypothetical protein Pmani_026431 [Petrolisthes manimaculis]|uniref:Uncharacterized protein n=1 Tax=Petrolisthes manimaculis TaxID=1843537 RepID=A0AAE1TXF5_9EUCA|nr:hypothetical protein Pmani_026431 [Petrolisthes manimaculis]